VKGVVAGIEPGDTLVLWGGGIYNWFDPLTLIRAIDRVRRAVPTVRLLFMGLRHPNPEIPEMRMAVAARELADELGLTGSHVFFNEGWVPFSERHNLLLDADIGVSTHLHHVETEFAYRTRILDYLWAGVPVVATDGDALSDLIEHRGLGLTVPPDDVDALAHALERMATDKDFATQCRTNIHALAPELRWSSVARPLVEFCRAPGRAPDLADPRLARQLGPRTRLLPRTGWRRDLRVAMTYLHEGGVRLLVKRLGTRTLRSLGIRRGR
jgi:glycosyltransferase involved in cell wall biosynthesis